MTAGRFVSYLRVSTERQGQSGLGLEAQRQAVADYLNGGRWVLLAEFVEVETGKRNDRPKLREVPLGALLSDIVSVVTGAHSGTGDSSSSAHFGDSGAPSDSTSVRSGDSDTVTVSYKNSNSISGNSDILDAVIGAHRR
jgi:hypothetical protein